MLIPKRRLTTIAEDWLDRQITEDVIKLTVFEADSNKSPGLDGFTTKFYQYSWSIIKADLINAVKIFFLTRAKC